MNYNNSHSPLSAEEKLAIRKADSFKRIRKRIKYGLLSIRRSFVKAILTAWVIIGAIALWFARERILQSLFAEDADLPFPLSLIDTGTITEWLLIASTYAIPILAMLMLLLMFGIFGINIWTRKVEEACITQGIYKRHTLKAPWLLDAYKESIYTVFVIYLNGSDEDDFRDNKAGLESHLGKIKELELVGTDILLLYTLTGKGKKNPNRADKEF